MPPDIELNDDDLDESQPNLKISDHIKVQPFKDVKVSTENNKIVIDITDPDTGETEYLARTRFELERDQSFYFTFNLIKELSEGRPSNTFYTLDKHITGCNPCTRDTIKSIKSKPDLYDKVKPILDDFFLAHEYAKLFDGNAENFFALYLKFNPSIEDILTLIKPVLISIFKRSIV